jgi:hypothetical protein
MLEKKRAVAEKKAEAIKTIKNKAGAGSKLAQGMPAFKAGGSVKKCKRDGIAVRGRTKGRTV